MYVQGDCLKGNKQQRVRERKGYWRVKRIGVPHTHTHTHTHTQTNTALWGPSNTEKRGWKKAGNDNIIEGVNLFKVYNMHVWNYYNEIPSY
jgi:hypothetical protein